MNRFVLLTLFILGCEARPTAMPPNVASTAGFPRTISDSFGQSVTLKSRPTRIVSTAPSNTEILFVIAAGPQVVGVTTYCSFPPEAAQCEKIGGFAPKTISIERIVALQPDLVLTTGRIQEPLTESLRKLGLPVLSYDANTLEDVISNIRVIGKATDNIARAEAVATKLEQRLARVRERSATLKRDQRPRVLFLLSEAPLITAGANTFAHQMIELAGGRNVFADVEQQFPRVSEESILRRNPEAIVMWANDDLTPRKQRLARRPGWTELAALRNDRVLAIDDDLISRAGPRLFDGLEQLADMLARR